MNFFWNKIVLTWKMVVHIMESCAVWSLIILDILKPIKVNFRTAISGKLNSGVSQMAYFIKEHGI